MKKIVGKSEALKLINQGKIIKFDTADGYSTIRKKSKGVYEIRVYVNGELKPEVLNGNFSNLMRTINKIDELYIEEDNKN